VLFEESAEGHPLRRLHDLALSNATLSLFPLTWTVMHEIDEKSPLADYDAERFKECDARLLLTIEARAHALGAAIFDMRVYTVDEVFVWNALRRSGHCRRSKAARCRSFPFEPGRAGPISAP
jgi:inward rectifier potassium channel